MWVAVLWAGYAILPLAFGVQGLGSSSDGDNTAIVVLPSVLLMAGAAALLVWQLTLRRHEGRLSAPYSVSV